MTLVSGATVIRELHKPQRFMSRPRKQPGCSTCARPLSILASIVRIAEPPFQVALAQDGQVFEYSNGEVFAKCGGCGKRRTLRQVLGKYAADKPCSAKCQAATGFQCECKCAGKNHGAAHDVGVVPERKKNGASRLTLTTSPVGSDAWHERRDLDALPSVFVRMGPIPRSGHSRNHRDDRPEAGVSVYRAWLDADGGYLIDARNMDLVSTALLVYGPAKARVVGGREVGRGSDGEPVLADCREVRLLDDPSFALVTQVEGVTQ